MELILIRHGHGENNLGLTRLGQKQAGITAKWLESRLMKYDLMEPLFIDLFGFTSSLSQTKETAKILWPELNWKQDTRLDAPDQSAQSDVRDRVMSWLETLERLIEAQRAPAAHIMCICAVIHDAWYEAFCGLDSNLPPAKAGETPIENGSVSIYRRVRCMQDCSISSHLRMHWKFHEYLVPWKDKI